ncbi:PspC domain-containing protein [Micromonospora sp. WMMA1363]|uniref:PspC domain-containing protein n=1 Tax=Micromonospora sp. WMMA1363 TaxID=3053985 RepID=UPI00259CD259|nr:PspC domain-containing protein [Micromonospora sp. WMMA1363]MDM4720725.1 PspC domain-containing protein [Micromonospora sp. WMMA1363]
MTEEAAQPPTSGATPPPVSAPADGTPPWASTDTSSALPPPSGGGASFTSRYGLVRPRDGRYLAGVCAAIGRATNTDPVLWRVLLAVLGFFGGIGILVYVSAWLIIPGEGDSASPVESMLGRGRSSMSPVTVIVLSILVAVSFAFIVTDAFRAVLLGAAILVCGALLLNRDRPAGPPVGAAPPGPVAPPPGPVPPVSYPAPAGYAVPWPAAAAPAVAPAMQSGPASPTPTAEPTVPLPAPPGTAAEPTAELPLSSPGETAPAAWGGVGGVTSTAWGGVGGTAAPAPPGGYRPAFAPHGPYAGSTPPPRPPAAPPKRPRERSALGAVTFSLIFLALGVVAVLDLLDVFPVGASAYFAAVLTVVGLGLLVGTWFGRARWLIALGLVTAAALAVATVAGSYDRIRGVDGAVTWAPASHADLATRYENSFGDAVLDLRAVDFTTWDTEITLAVNFGEATVVVPPDVDVTVTADVNAGDAVVFGRRPGTPGERGGLDGPLLETTDLGADGPGGGKLRLFVHVNAGELEVTR